MKAIERRQKLSEQLATYNARHLSYSENDRKRVMTSIRLSMGRFIPDDGLRRKVLGWLWGLDTPLSTGDLTDNQLMAIKNWLQAFPIGDEWTIGREAIDEINQIVSLLGRPPMVQAALELGGEITAEGEDLFSENEPDLPEPDEPPAPVEETPVTTRGNDPTPEVKRATPTNQFFEF